MTTRERFRATLLDGHKGTAFELPFDPAERWAISPRKVSNGRRGHFVQGTLNGVAFASVVVPRAGRHWVLVDSALAAQAGVAAGSVVQGTIEPRAADDAPPAGSPRARAPRAPVK